MILFIDSSKIKNDSLVDQAVVDFNSSAKKNKGAILYCLCDVAVDKLCLKMLHRFDILREELPLVRIIQNMDLAKKVFYKFKLREIDIQNNMAGYSS